MVLASMGFTARTEVPKAVLPNLNVQLDVVKVGSVSLPIAVGPLVMMHPILAKMRYSRISDISTDRTLAVTSLVNLERLRTG